ncbi:hypothetical protein OJ996_14850 [Luteolibacter sp. GHJ8]|uniref:Uncharacterized protein n=1 Tax=Luteolibacter rhizosphaerae TaxID=2989719 RepID=A0ABT3G5V3_9BACT|nr:hypothetical protein [Luteolibacter rhizosphaerae]MCW1914864.1 hypothetical protein [Luteolibacter rhizosphaerae]
MPDATERFISAARSHLEDNAEMQVVAERELRGMMEGHAEQDAAIQIAADRLRKRGRGGRAAVAAAVVIALVSGGWQVFRAYEQREMIKASINLEYPDEFPRWLAKEDATEAQRWMLFNETEPLWESDRKNPAYFANHSRRLLKDYRRLPEDFLKTAEAIDPLNGYFLFMAAENAAKGSVESDPDPTWKKGDPVKWTIKKADAYAESLALLRKAIALPEWNTHRSEIIRGRFEALGETRDLVDRTGKAYLQIQNDGIWFNNIPYVLAARAEECGRNGDREGLRELATVWETLVPRLLDQAHPTLFYGIVTAGGLVNPIDNITESASKLGERELVEKFRRYKEALLTVTRSPRENPHVDERSETTLRHGSQQAVASSLEQFAIASMPVATKADLEPGRLAEYAMVDRGLALLCWAIFGLASVVVALFRFRGGMMARKMSGLLSGLIRPGDHARVIGGGILLPFALWMLITRFTPLGAREWSAGIHGMTIPMGQWLGTMVLMLLLPVLLVKRAVASRAGFLGLGMQRPVWGWVAAGLVVIGILSYGAVIPASEPDSEHWGGLYGMQSEFVDLNIMEADGPAQWLLLFSTGMIALGLAWLVGCGGWAIFSAHGKMLERSMVSRALVPAYVAGMFLMPAAARLYHAEECRRIAQDRWMGVSEESAPVSIYEHRLAESYLERLRTAFEGVR